MPSEADAVEELMALGLSEYEARCFVALTQLSDGTAKEVSQVADVPQSRVYDVTEQLHEQGLIGIQESEPKRYFALPVAESLETLQEDYAEHLDAAGEHLDTLERRETEDGGVWEIATRQDVSIRIGMHVGNATEDVYLLVGHEELLEADLLGALADARERGVTILVEVPSSSARERVHDVVPEAHVAVTDFAATVHPEMDQDPGRLLMVDHETILLSARREGLVPNDPEETGVWGSAVDHGLVVWVQQLLDARRERLQVDTATE